MNPVDIERVQFSSVAGARLFSLGKIQIRVSFGDLESKGISHLFQRVRKSMLPTPTPEFRIWVVTRIVAVSADNNMAVRSLRRGVADGGSGTSRAPLHEEMYGEFLGEEYTGENHSVM